MNITKTAGGGFVPYTLSIRVETQDDETVLQNAATRLYASIHLSVSILGTQIRAAIKA